MSRRHVEHEPASSVMTAARHGRIEHTTAGERDPPIPRPPAMGPDDARPVPDAEDLTRGRGERLGQPRCSEMMYTRTEAVAVFVPSLTVTVRSWLELSLNEVPSHRWSVGEDCVETCWTGPRSLLSVHV